MKVNKNIKTLYVVLADSYALALKTQNFHWNVSGPFFHSLHKLFEEQYGEITAAIDEIAERIRALGERAPGSFGEFSKLTTLKDATSQPDAFDMVADLLHDHRRVEKSLNAALKAAQNEGDEPTADMLIERLQAHQKHAWMLETTLEGM